MSPIFIRTIRVTQVILCDNTFGLMKCKVHEKMCMLEIRFREGNSTSE